MTGEQAVEVPLETMDQPEQADDVVIVRGNFALAVVAGSVAALIGAAIWAVVAYTTGYSIGYLALLIGIIVGFAVRRFGGGTAQKFRILGAALSAVGWALGTWLCDVAYVSKQVGQPFLTTMARLDPGQHVSLAIAAADAMDLLFLAIAVYEGYKFAGPAKR